MQVYQPMLTLRYEIPAQEALRFIRTLKNQGRSHTLSYVTQTGKIMRLSQRRRPGAVQLHGTHRIKVLEPLLHQASSLRIWADEKAGTSAWEVMYDIGSFFLMLSPETHRGFSGEGQMLDILASKKGQDLVSYVKARLNWQPHINTLHLAGELNTTPEQIDAALAVLGTRGLAGYDVSHQCYFHRELPFDNTLIEKQQPRLQNARKLLTDQKVQLYKQIGENACDVRVEGNGVTHLVRLREAGDRCSCPWFSRYHGERGACKHILAARLLVHTSEY